MSPRVPAGELVLRRMRPARPASAVGGSAGAGAPAERGGDAIAPRPGPGLALPGGGGRGGGVEAGGGLGSGGTCLDVLDGLGFGIYDDDSDDDSDDADLSAPRIPAVGSCRAVDAVVGGESDRGRGAGGGVGTGGNEEGGPGGADCGPSPQAGTVRN